MKNLDIMSYYELTALLQKVEGELSIVRLNDIKSDRMKQKEVGLRKQLADIKSYRTLAKFDDKECIRIGAELLEKVLKANGVFSDQLFSDLASRITARNVDVIYKHSVPTLDKVKSKVGFKRWLKYKLQTLINAI